ncbi:unnamed protein product [Umbelopsis ramanniana]
MTSNKPYPDGDPGSSRPLIENNDAPGDIPSAMLSILPSIIYDDNDNAILQSNLYDDDLLPFNMTEDDIISIENEVFDELVEAKRHCSDPNHETRLRLLPAEFLTLHRPPDQKSLDRMLKQAKKRQEQNKLKAKARKMEMRRLAAEKRANSTCSLALHVARLITLARPALVATIM